LASGLFPSAACTSSDEPDSEQELYLVDAHSQFVFAEVDDPIPYDDVLVRMGENDVRFAILAVVGDLSDSLALADFAQDHPDRITAAVSAKVDDEELIDFQETLTQQIDSGLFGAAAEMLLYHAAKEDASGTTIAPKIEVLPGDSDTQAYVRACLDNDWPVVLHIEFGSMESDENEQRWSQFMSGLEQLLETHPDHPFVLAHVGELSTEESERLLTTHSNVYLMTNFTDLLHLCTGEPVEGVSMDSWLELFDEHFDRVVLGLDRVWSSHWEQEAYARDGSMVRSTLATLSDEAAIAIAHGNAERLWGLTVSQ